MEPADEFVPTMLFEPEKYGFRSEKSLQQLVWDMITATEQLGIVPLQLLRCVLLVGGTVQYPFVDVRLKEEIDKLWPALASKMHVIRAKDSQLAVLNGQRLATRTIFKKHKEDGKSFFKYFEEMK